MPYDDKRVSGTAVREALISDDLALAEKRLRHHGGCEIDD
ncbi:hypothetical protein BN1221_02341 [Brenneria goodwinii]|uniref:Uncharacterized protein n=1 Tax=Brenneria goodwinii TaxID=1109412 RepID=A0A0G4JVA6_9GAMM|nr:hypothetical protein BN1221_02341 [Brenneria goodwinii]